MIVFVVGTGRCGTVTFSKACTHIINFESGHEVYTKKLMSDFDVPDNSIQVDPHLVHVMPSLMEKYPDAKWVHLIRDKEDCVKSIAKSTGILWYARLVSMREAENVTPKERRRVSEMYYEYINQFVASQIEDKDHMTIHLKDISSDWSNFWKWIGARGNYKRSLKELKVKHNNGSKKYRGK